MPANKTVETSADVAVFVAAVADPGQRADAEALIEMMTKASGEPAKMWGPSIIGFGTHHYRYESGREGDTPRIAFSPRKGQTVLYALGGTPTFEANLARLGKHKAGKGCLYIKRLTDVDLQVLTEMVRASLAAKL
jgi:Domain of unknown function (DU1801)